MADLPIEFDATRASELARVLDTEGKITRALEGLGPVADRDVLLIDAPADGIRGRQLAGVGARVTACALGDAGAASADVLVSCWTSFRGVDAAEMAAAERALRPGGRLLVLHDYGRDDVSRLRGDQPEYGAWSRRDGPFLRGGFKIRVVHCFWTFASIDDGQTFLADAFGAVGETVAAGMTRPRITYNVAVYHRSFG